MNTCSSTATSPVAEKRCYASVSPNGSKRYNVVEEPTSNNGMMYVLTSDFFTGKLCMTASVFSDFVFGDLEKALQTFN